MTEPTKIDFHHGKISKISDFTDLIEILFPSNFNQQHAATCILFELKWAKHIVPNLTYIEKQYNISRRILQRTRAKLSRLGFIEHINYLNNRYGGQHGWKFSTCFERTLNKLASKCADFRNTEISSREKEAMFLSFVDARRGISKRNNILSAGDGN